MSDMAAILILCGYLFIALGFNPLVDFIRSYVANTPLIGRDEFIHELMRDCGADFDTAMAKYNQYQNGRTVMFKELTQGVKSKRVYRFYFKMVKYGGHIARVNLN